MSWKRRAIIGLGATVSISGLAAAAFVAWVSTAEILRYPDWPAPQVVASTDPAVIERGRYLAHGPGHCATCHSTDDRDHFEKILTEPLHGGLEFAMGPIATRYAANLTPDATTGIGRRTDAELARAIRSGVMPDGELSLFMSASMGEMSDEDLVAVISYLRSLPPVTNEVPVGNFGFLGKALVLTEAFVLEPRPVTGPAHVPPGDEPSVARGQYLADHLAFCKACHTPFDPTTFKPNGPAFSGGPAEASHGADSDHEFAPPNLTSAPTGFVGRVDEDGFVARLRSGRTYASSIMPWENYSAMTDADLRSIYRYLRSVEPTDIDRGPSYRLIGSFEPPP